MDAAVWRSVSIAGLCAVTRGHVMEAGGGLWFSSYPELEGCLDQLRADPELRRRMEAAGGRYVRERFGWDRIIRRYRDEVLVSRAST